MKLYRAMIVDSDGMPKVGRSARAFGIRKPVEAGTSDPDVTPTAPDEIIQPGIGGMSVAPNDPANPPPFRRPASLGGRGRDPVWVIDTDDLGADLQFRQDSPRHGLIEPARPMILEEYEAALAATRATWVQHSY